METMLRCFSSLADFEAVGSEDWVEKGKNGETVEGNLLDLIWHQAPQPPPEKSYQDEDGQKAWARIYHERNRKFAEADWEKEKQT